MRILYSPQHKLHSTNDILLDGKPFVTEEVPLRAELILGRLLRAGVGRQETPADSGLMPILAVHTPEYLDFLQTIYAATVELTGDQAPVFPATFATRGVRRKSRHPYGLAGYYSFGTWSPILAGTWQAAYWSAQCAIAAADAVLAGEPSAYALCRPPGHHAAAELYGGFCYLNNAAIAARRLQAGTDGEATKIAILDVDFHHGNGTQEIFYRDPSVLYCSLHAHPDQDYPYFWGEADETGEGPGAGANRNFPLDLGTGDDAYLTALEEALAEIRRYAPAYLVLSAGMDIGEDDPAGGFRITLDGMGQIGARIQALGLPTVIVQEGGYLLEKLGERAQAMLAPFA